MDNPPAAAGPKRQPNDLSQPLQYLKGIGPRRAALLARLGMHSVNDALYYLPYRYEDRGNFKRISRIVYGSYETVAGVVASMQVVTTSRRRMKIFELTIKDDSGSITGIWFNQPFMQRSFEVGQRIILSGVPKPDNYKAYRPVIENPEYEVIEEEGDATIHTGRIVPIYRTTSGLSVRQLRAIIKRVVDEFSGLLKEFLPDGFHAKYNIPFLPDAIREAHFPENEKDIDILAVRGSRAHKRLIFDEFLLLELGLAMMKKGRVLKRTGMKIKSGGDLFERFKQSLPFELTADQKTVISEVIADLEKDIPMARLVQGDVGSGKTVVAVSAILQAAEAGFQSALMAPTEILAEQHYLNLKTYLDPMGVKVGLLTGSLKKKEKEQAYHDISEGITQVAVGTHSLIQEGVAFKRLGLAVIDEQHRFGVMQRALLGDKGANPHVLVMTATPIPRSLAMTLYGDLDVSTIRMVPSGRKQVITKVFDEKNRAEAYKLVKRELLGGRQAYVVYPLVEESERSDLKAAREGAERLKESFAGHGVGLIHGKMKAADKVRVMDEFRSGKIDILVSTTVIEVGVDVPNAAVIVIEHAERFGLAQLHQLRGRVGRSGYQSYCALLASNFSENARMRLSAMLKCKDGFEIAEEDLNLRGPGEFLGTKQSGLPDLVVGDILRDGKILEAARKEAFSMADKDPGLSSPAFVNLKAALVARWSGKMGFVAAG